MILNIGVISSVDIGVGLLAQSYKVTK